MAYSAMLSPARNSSSPSSLLAGLLHGRTSVPVVGLAPDANLRRQIHFEGDSDLPIHQLPLSVPAEVTAVLDFQALFESQTRELNQLRKEAAIEEDQLLEQEARTAARAATATRKRRGPQRAPTLAQQRVIDSQIPAGSSPPTEAVLGVAPGLYNQGQEGHRIVVDGWKACA